MSLLGIVNRHLIALPFVKHKHMDNTKFSGHCHPSGVITATADEDYLRRRTQDHTVVLSFNSSFTSSIIYIFFFQVPHPNKNKAENIHLLFGKKSHSFFMERYGFGVKEWCRCEKMSTLSKSWSQVKYQADTHVLQVISQQLLPATWKKYICIVVSHPF